MKLFWRIIFFWLITNPFLFIVFGLLVKGRENLYLDKPFLLVCNHNSHLDTIILLSLFGVFKIKDIRPVAAGDYFRKSKIVDVVVSNVFNTLYISRNKALRTDNPIEQMMQAIKNGQSLIVYPEGTRGKPNIMTEFKVGAGILAQKIPDLPVIPVYIHGSGKIFPKGAWYPVPLVVKVNIGIPEIYTGTPREITEKLEIAVGKLQKECEY